MFSGSADTEAAAGPDICKRANCASAAQHTMTIFARSVRAPSLKVNPVTVIVRPAKVSEDPAAMRINTSGSGTAGASPAGNGGKARRGVLVAAAILAGAMERALSAGGTMKISRTIGSTRNQVAPCLWGWSP
ncbi:Uncharacterised protein [Mycobacteroides abscessus subsp. abscessus]|nr:Uncharacterised protein [Mycobacteroides abscessus subsp. abscessus]